MLGGGLLLNSIIIMNKIEYQKVSFSIECNDCFFKQSAEIDPEKDLKEQFDVFLREAKNLNWTVDDDEIYCTNCNEEGGDEHT